MLTLLLPLLTAVVPSLLSEMNSAGVWEGRVATTVESSGLDTDNSVTYDVVSFPDPSDSLVGAEYVVTWPEDHIEAYVDGSAYLRAGSGLMTELDGDSLSVVRRHGRLPGQDLICTEVAPHSLLHKLIAGLRDGSYEVADSTPESLTLASTATSRRIKVSVPSRPFDGRASVRMTTGGAFPTTTVSAWQPVTPSDTDSLTFDKVFAAHKRLFERYNPRFITPESLVGTSMPPFRLRSLDGDRYEWRSGLSRPGITLIAILDSPDDIEKVRSRAAETADGRCELILVFTANNPDEVREWIGTPRANERVLLRATDLLRATGNPSLPAIFIIDPSGTVTSCR
ncbi:MAG: hypothetical protein K2K55_04015 [Duncaniella sp.]|nr:hypothetical protein [Duncaniella sp.]